MHLVLVSDHTLTSSPQHPSQFAKSLVHNGLQVHWLADTGTIEALGHDPELHPAEASEMPATCRHVVPYTLHHLSGVTLIGIEPAVWRDTALHTRLFTFLCLLHRAHPLAVLHAWGSLPTAYLTVYTATFLRLPGTVFYTPSCLQDGPQQSFLWQWVAQHTALAFTASASDRERLLHTSPLPPRQVKVMDPTQPGDQALMQNFQDVAKNPYNR